MIQFQFKFRFVIVWFTVEVIVECISLFASNIYLEKFE